MKTAAVYARYSSDNQREESIDAQIRAIKEYAKHEGVSIVKIYADEAKSATTDQRPQFLQMMEDAVTGLFDYVIVHKLDRFSRDRYDAAFYKRHLRKNNVRLLSVLEHLDDSPESVLMESVLEGLAEYYSKNLARETMKGLKENAYKCKHTGGLPPLGYDIDAEKNYIINKTEAEAVRLIFDMYADGCGYGRIVDVLNEKAYKTKRGKPFGKNSIHDILMNEKYIGIYSYNKAVSKIGGSRNNHARKPEEEIIRIPDGVPAIVQADVFERVQSKMKSNQYAGGALHAKRVYLLSGLIKCGLCGGAMIGCSVKGISYYQCNTRKRQKTCDMKAVRKDYIEQSVIDALYDNLFCDSAIGPASDRFYHYATTTMQDAPEMAQEYSGQLQRVENEISNIVNAIANGMFHESMKTKMDELEASKAALKIRLAEAELKTRTHAMSREQIYGYLKQYQDIKSMPPEEQKKAINTFVSEVVIYEQDYEISILTDAPIHKTKTASNEAGGVSPEVGLQMVTPPRNLSYPKEWKIRIFLDCVRYQRHKK